MRLLTLLLVTVPAFAAGELTVYDLLALETHKFAIIYDVSATEEGTQYCSFCETERAIDRATEVRLYHSSNPPASADILLTFCAFIC